MGVRLLPLVATAIVLGAARAAILLRLMLLHASASGQTRAPNYTRTRAPQNTNKLARAARVCGKEHRPGTGKNSRPSFPGCLPTCCD